MTAQISLPRFLRSLLVAALAFSFLAATSAARADDLVSTLSASKVAADAEGKETLTSADEAKPGDIVQYTASYRNETGMLIQNLKPMLPVPAGTSYQAGSAQPEATEASLDGSNFELIPLKRTVTLEDGTKEEQEVPSSEYRALRWTIGELQPAAETKVTARVRVLANTPAE